MNKEKISTVRTYFLLRKALYELLLEMPFEKITLTHICRRSMVPRSTFYRYFEDKHDLMRYAVLTLFEDAGLSRDVIFSTDIQSLRRFFEILFSHMEARRAEYVKIYNLNRQGILIETLRNFLIQIFTDKLREAEAAGVRLTVPESIFTYLLADFYMSAGKCYLESETAWDAREFVEGIVRFANKEFFE